MPNELFPILKTDKFMKKVAALTLILVLTTLTTESWAQFRQASTTDYATARVTDRRFRKILGSDYNKPQVAAPAERSKVVYDEKPLRKRRKKTTVDREYQQARRSTDRRATDRGDVYPDYERPSHLIEMSLRFAPNAAVNVVEGVNNYQGFADNGTAVRPSVGVSLDYFFFKDRYAFSSGLWYTIKQVGYRIPGSYGESRWNPGAPVKEGVYNLQYVQVPLTVKLFANNLFPTSRLYIQTGGVLDVKLAEKALMPSTNAYYQVAQRDGTRRQFGFADAAWLLGGGIQFGLNGTNAINVGVTYQRGLLEIARPKDLSVRNRMVSLDLGFKF